MLVKTEKQKMPFVPNFRIIFIILGISFIFSLILALEFGATLPISIIILITIMLIWRKSLIQKAEKLVKEYEDFENFSGNQLEFLRKRQNILQILSSLKRKIPIPEINIENERQKNNEAIEHFLGTRKNENIAISHISDGLDIEENANFIKKISLPFSEKQKELRKKWIYDLTEQVKILKIIWWIALFTFYGIPLAFFLFFVLQRERIGRPTLFETWRITDEKSDEYLELLQISAFYHAKLDDFYHFVFHENNFLPETSLLFADIITLLSENFVERKKFLEKYRLFWGNWLGLFYVLPYKISEKIYAFKIFQKKIPPEVEAIISEEEENLKNEIKNIQNKIREWAEFEKNKIATISSQNEEFFPNLKLSSKRQEILIENFEKLMK